MSVFLTWTGSDFSRVPGLSQGIFPQTSGFFENSFQGDFIQDLSPIKCSRVHRAGCRLPISLLGEPQFCSLHLAHVQVKLGDMGISAAVLAAGIYHIRDTSMIDEVRIEILCRATNSSGYEPHILRFDPACRRGPHYRKD